MSNKIDSIKVSGVTYNIKDLNAARTITLTQAEYDALQTKDPNVFYIISDSSIDYVTSAETQSAITQAVSGKADSSSVYLKSETSGATEISTALDSKLDATAYTPTDLSNYYTTAQTDTKISQAVSGKANSSDVVTNLSDGKLVNQAIGVNITKNGSNTRHVVFVADSGLTATTGELTLPHVSVDFNTVAAKSDIAGKADTTAVTTVNNALTAHTADTTVHVTQSDKNTWNAKSDFSGSYNDLTDKPTIPTVPTSNTAFTNDAGYLVASDITGKADTTAVTTVNNALTAHTANTTVHVTAQDKTNWNAKSDFSGDYNDLTNKPTIPTVPTSNTAFTNDAGYLVASDIAGKADTTAVTAVNDTLTAHTANTTVHVTAQDKTNWNAKSDFSGSYNDLTDKPTIPTVPTSNTAFTNDAGYITDSALDGYATETYVSAGLNTKQDTLESGVNIKTINNYSLVGSGNINIAGTGGNNVVELTQAEYDELDPKDPSAFYIITDAEGGDLANYMTSAQTQTAINQATSGKTNQSDFTGHTANTTVHITSAERTAWNAKSDFSGSYNDLTNKLSAGTNITIVDNVISAEGGGGVNVVQTTGTSTADVMSQDAVTTQLSGTVKLSNLTTYYIDNFNSYDSKLTVDYHRFSINNSVKGNSLWYGKINNQYVCKYAASNTTPSGLMNLSLVETSAITTSISSSSTDAQVPSAKCVYDTLGGLKLVKLTQSAYDALSPNYDSNTLYVIVN